MVVGGLVDEIENLHPDYVTFLHRAAAAGVPMTGACTGAFILHRAGLMQGYRCCVSWFHHGDFLEEFEGMRLVSNQIFVVDWDRLSCSGGASSAHLAAFLVDRHIGPAAARKSLAIMIFDEAMTAERPQLGLPLELFTRVDLVRRALLVMQQTLDAPLTVSDLVEPLGVSRRKPERHFARALALTPVEAGMNIRLAQVRWLLERGDRSATQIVAETGLCDASHLIRQLRAVEGAKPEVWRNSLRAVKLRTADAAAPG